MGTKRLAELEAEGTPNNRKRVSFGHYISPELFDKNLPPDTPVRKGAVPVSELKKGAPVDSPRPGALARSLAIKRSTSNTGKRVSLAPATPSIPEDSPKGVLKRQENDLPRTKINSGYRSSPRTSTGSESDADVDTTPSKQPEEKHVGEDTDVEDMDVDVAKTSTQPTTSPRKVVTPVIAKKTSGKSPKTAKKSKSETPVLPVKRKPSVSPPKSHDKRQKLSTPAKSDTPVSSKNVAKTPMVKTPPKGKTPNMKTPKDNILDSPKSASKTKTPKDSVKTLKNVPKTPMVKTPAKGNTPIISTPKDEFLESPKKTTIPKTPAKTPKVGKTPKSVVKKLGKTPKQSTLYSGIVKKNLGISNRKVKVSRVEGGKISKVKAQTKVVVKTP